MPTAANSTSGERTRVIAYPFPIPHLQSVYSSAKATPDGKWALYLGQRHERTDVFLVKVPPYPQVDGVLRNTFVSVPLLIPPAIGTAKVTVQFGYADAVLVQATFTVRRDVRAVW